LEKLVERAQAGDGAAVEELYRRHQPFIYNYILKRVKNPVYAEDLTSKVFIRAIERMEQYSYRPGHGYINWLTRIAHNMIVDEWRKHKRTNLWHELPEQFFGEDMSAEEMTFLALDEDDFKKYLDFCTPQQAEVIKMKYQFDLSNEQIAERLGTSVGAVKSMQHRAFDNIKEGIDGVNW
jgi:RNA polymerase sigma-70 factor (ECF subfamily)